jgi:hypothetical protein
MSWLLGGMPSAMPCGKGGEPLESDHVVTMFLNSI